jgi:hypothetical protein
MPQLVSTIIYSNLGVGGSAEVTALGYESSGNEA